MGTFEARGAARRASWPGIVARSYQEAAKVKCVAQQAIPPHERAEAIWQLVLRTAWGDDAAEYRLDRSVACVERQGMMSLD